MEEGQEEGQEEEGKGGGVVQVLNEGLESTDRAEHFSSSFHRQKASARQAKIFIFITTTFERRREEMQGRSDRMGVGGPLRLPVSSQGWLPPPRFRARHRHRDEERKR